MQVDVVLLQWECSQVEGLAVVKVDLPVVVGRKVEVKVLHLDLKVVLQVLVQVKVKWWWWRMGS